MRGMIVYACCAGVLWMLADVSVSAQTTANETTVTETAAVAQSSIEATKRKADALIAYLESQNDKRVKKVVVGKFGFGGGSSEEYVNYTIKIGEVKYQVGRPGKDKKGVNYVVFDVWAGKTSYITVGDDYIDGSVDSGMDVKNASKEDKKIYGTPAYQLKDRERWQAEYEKYLDVVIGYLGIKF